MNNINSYRINNTINQNYINKTSTQNRNSDNVKSNFENTLNNFQSKEIKFSKHAQIRMDKRNLSLDKNDMLKLEEALGKAEKKGIKETLIIMNNQAFIANVANKTIITAVSNDGSKENIFTNIDGAVII